MVKSLMVQGTASDAGKSIIAACLLSRRIWGLIPLSPKKEMKWAGLRLFRLRQLAKSRMSA